MSIMPPTPLAYEGQVVVPWIQRTFPPTNSFNKFPVPTVWLDTSNSNAYILVSKALGVAEWVLLGGSPGPLNTLTGDSGGAVAPVAGNIDIIGGVGCTVTGSSGQLQINVTGAGLTWTEVTGISQAMTGNNGYIASNGSRVTLTLPLNCSQGAEIVVMGKGAGGWTISIGGGQTVYFGSATATTSLSSTNRRDSITLVCITTNTEFQVKDVVGNITYS